MATRTADQKRPPYSLAEWLPGTPAPVAAFELLADLRARGVTAELSGARRVRVWPERLVTYRQRALLRLLLCEVMTQLRSERARPC